LLAHGRWFSPGTPASSTTKTDRHDIAEILLKVALKHQKSNQSINQVLFALDEHTQLDLYRASSLKQQFTGKHVVPFGHIILIPSQSVFVHTV
jgi:hypothetical protein